MKYQKIKHCDNITNHSTETIDPLKRAPPARRLKRKWSKHFSAEITDGYIFLLYSAFKTTGNTLVIYFFF